MSEFDWQEEIESKRPKTVMGFTKLDGERLYGFIKKNNLKTIVETGVCFGFSSSYILEAIGKEGRLISIDPFLKPFKELIVPKRHYDRWIAVQGTSADCLDPILKAFGPVDLFLHDSKHDYETMMMEYTIAHKNNVRFLASDDVGGPYCGTVWKDFLKQYKYQELFIGSRSRIAKRLK